jgi:hypothetical protein
MQSASMVGARGARRNAREGEELRLVPLPSSLQIHSSIKQQTELLRSAFTLELPNTKRNHSIPESGMEPFRSITF